MSGDLAGWLLTQISEDEATARAALRDLAATPRRPAETDLGHWRREPGNTGTEITGTNMTIYEEGGHTEEQAEHIVRWDPSRVLAECAAKRAIIETLAPIAADDWFEPGTVFSPGDETEQAAFVLQMLAQPYSDRPGFRPEWQVTP